MSSPVRDTSCEFHARTLRPRYKQEGHSLLTHLRRVGWEMARLDSDGRHQRREEDHLGWRRHKINPRRILVGILSVFLFYFIFSCFVAVLSELLPSQNFVCAVVVTTLVVWLTFMYISGLGSSEMGALNLEEAITKLRRFFSQENIDGFNSNHEETVGDLLQFR